MSDPMIFFGLVAITAVITYALTKASEKHWKWPSKKSEKDADLWLSPSEQEAWDRYIREVVREELAERTARPALVKRLPQVKQTK